jgi:hypothetical protein
LFTPKALKLDMALRDALTPSLPPALPHMSFRGARNE